MKILDLFEGETREGTVESFSTSSSGYLNVKIDGKTYKTLDDIGSVPKAGTRATFTVREKSDSRFSGGKVELISFVKER